VQNTPDNSAFFNFLGRTTILGMPMLIVAFLVLALVAWLALRWTRFGRFVYAMGDNPAAARIVGLPVRPMIVAEHVITALIAYAAGLVMAAASSGMSTRVYNSTMIYDVLLVVVLGGIGLSGGRGGVRNILVGTLLVGVLLDGMTIMDVPYIEQNLIKAIILLCAIVVDSIINPRDERLSWSCYLSGVSRESLVTTSCVSNINRALERITCHTLVLHSLSSSFFCSTRRCLLSFP